MLKALSSAYEFLGECIVTAWQFPKALSLILVTDSGRLTSFSDGQLQKAVSPIILSPSSAFMYLRPAQLQNALAPICVTDAGMSTASI